MVESKETVDYHGHGFAPIPILDAVRGEGEDYHGHPMGSTPLLTSQGQPGDWDGDKWPEHLIDHVDASGTGLCVDYEVDPDGGGSHSTLATAVVDAIQATGTSGTRVIALCGNVTEGSISLNDLGSSARIVIISADKARNRITAPSGEDIFNQSATAGNTDGGIEFRNIGLTTDADKAVYDVNTTVELRHLIFDSCDFGNGYLCRQDGNDSLGAIGLRVANCTGTLSGFYDVTGASASFGPDLLQAFDNDLSLTHFWDGGSTAAPPDFTRISGGYYAVTAAVAFASGTFQQHFHNLVILSSIEGPLFTSGGATTSIDNLTFQDIILHTSHEDGDFMNLASASTNNNDGIMISNVYGFPSSGVTPTGTFVTIDADWLNVHIGDVHAPAWGTVYTGPSSTGVTDRLAIVTKTGAYTATDADLVILCDASSGAFTITLPTAVGRAGKVFHIKKIDSSANGVTVDGNGSQTIDGATTQVIATQYNSIKITSDASNWHIL